MAEAERSSSKMYLHSNVLYGTDDEGRDQFLPAGTEVSASTKELGGKDAFEQLVEEGVVRPEKHDPPADTVVGAAPSIEEREGDRMLKDEDTKDATNIEQVYDAASKKVGARTVGKPLR